MGRNFHEGVTSKARNASLLNISNVHIPPELVRAAQAREPGAIDELIEASYRRAYALAVRLLNDRDEAADATQESFIRLFRNLKRLEDPGAYQTWMYRIVNNVCMNILRKRGRIDLPGELPEEVDIVDAEETAVSNISNEKLEKFVSELPDTYRTVVVLRDIYGFSGDDTAQTLGITEGAVKVRLHRARKLLRDAIGSATEDDERTAS